MSKFTLHVTPVAGVFYCPELDAYFSLTQINSKGEELGRFEPSVWDITQPETLGEKHMKEVLS